MTSISDILTASYSSSREADTLGKELKKFIGAESNYEIIRLALGRSLGLESFPDPAPDAKGGIIKGLQLFGDTESCNYLWIGLFGEVLRRRGEAAFTLEAFHKLVRDHWHRGIHLLQQDREEANDEFKAFIDILVRKANLSEQTPFSADSGTADLEVKELDDAVCDALLKLLRTIGVSVEIRETLSGPRINRYKLFLSKAADRRTLESHLDQLGFELGIGKTLSLTDAREPKTCYLDQPRPPEEWQTVNISHFKKAAETFDLEAIRMPVSPGVTLDGKPLIFDLAAMPHLLLGGTTGSGKSVCLNALLLSLLSYADRRPLRFALIDPKQVEFSAWRGHRHLFREVATDAATARDLLETLIEEMDRRYERFASLGVKDLAGARAKGDPAEWIVLGVDELSDLVMQDKANEPLLVRLAQMGRAAGIHMILATQRPDADTFSGKLRTNCPARIALRVSRGSESKIIMDEPGAERLQGAGDMIFRGADGILIRAHSYNILVDDVAEQLALA
jgi:DNA segregation ATPase FtsK/SpoIIIE, S-DNA-T family